MLYGIFNHLDTCELHVLMSLPLTLGEQAETEGVGRWVIVAAFRQLTYQISPEKVIITMITINHTPEVKCLFTYIQYSSVPPIISKYSALPPPSDDQHSVQKLQYFINV